MDAKKIIEDIYDIVFRNPYDVTDFVAGFPESCIDCAAGIIYLKSRERQFAVTITEINEERGGEA